MNVCSGKSFFLQQVKRFVNHVAVAAQKSIGLCRDIKGFQISGYTALEIPALLTRHTMDIPITVCFRISRTCGYP